MKGLRYLMTGLFAVFAALVWSHPARGQVKQPPEVLEAYRVCEKFHHILGRDLDYGNAFEATFVREPARRLAIARAVGEFEENGLQNVSDEMVIKAAINRSRIFYLALILGRPEEEEEQLFFPPEIEQILDRKPPALSAEFSAYAAQLERDAALFRAHIERLAAGYPTVAERVRKFREEYLKAILPPDTWVVEPQRSLGEWRGLRNNELYYEIGDCTVIREGEQMRIVHIRLFSGML